MVRRRIWDVPCGGCYRNRSVGYGRACIRVGVECAVACCICLAEWVYLCNDRPRGKFFFLFQENEFNDH